MFLLFFKVPVLTDTLSGKSLSSQLKNFILGEIPPFIQIIHDILEKNECQKR